MRILWLGDVLRAAGLTVVEHTGWQDRVIAGTWNPECGIVHATAAPRTQSDADQVRIVRDGRSDLPGPIAVACVDRTGRWHVLGSGRCNTTLAGTAGPFEGLGNARCLGVEACNDNGLQQPAEPWPPVQYRSYVVGWAAICRRLGWTQHRLVGHKEHTPGRKTDPTFSMPQFRADVAAVLADAWPAPTPEEDDMTIYLFSYAGRRWRGNLVQREPVASGDETALKHIAGKGGVTVVDWGPAEVANPDAFGRDITGLLTAAEGREVQRDAQATAERAALRTLVEGMNGAAGTPLTGEQLEQLVDAVGDAALVAGQQVLAEMRRLETEREAGLRAQLAAETPDPDGG